MTVSILIPCPACEGLVLLPVPVDRDGNAEEAVIFCHHHCPAASVGRLTCRLTVHAEAERAFAEWWCGTGGRPPGEDRSGRMVLLPTPQAIDRILGRKALLVGAAG